MFESNACFLCFLLSVYIEIGFGAIVAVVTVVKVVVVVTIVTVVPVVTVVA